MLGLLSTIIRGMERADQESVYHGKKTLAHEHNWALITSTSARKVARTSARRLGHPARAGVFVVFFSQPPTPRPSSRFTIKEPAKGVAKGTAEQKNGGNPSDGFPPKCSGNMLVNTMGNACSSCSLCYFFTVPSGLPPYIGSMTPAFPAKKEKKVLEGNPPPSLPTKLHNAWTETTLNEILPHISSLDALLYTWPLTIIKKNIKMILLQNNIHESEVHFRSAVLFGQALPGLLITAHHLYASLS